MSMAMGMGMGRFDRFATGIYLWVSGSAHIICLVDLILLFPIPFQILMVLLCWIYS